MGLFDQLQNVGSSILFGDQQSKNVTQKQEPQVPQFSQQTPQSTSAGLYNPQLEKLIDIALADGDLTEKEKQILFKKAEGMGVDLDEFEMVLEARLYERRQQLNAPNTTQAAPTSSKFGDVKKCPTCGAIVEPFTIKCQECGFEFRNIEANCTIQRLFNLLNNVEVTSTNSSKGLFGFFSNENNEQKIHDRKKEIIQNFPIPTTKEDILEFLTLAVPLAKIKAASFLDLDGLDEKLAMVPVWKAKCEQIIMKARFSMKDDPQTLAEINEYGKQLGIK